MDESFLTRLTNCRGNANSFCCKAINTLVRLMLEDEAIFEYIMSMPGDSLAISRLVNWFIPYMAEKKQETFEDVSKGYKGQSTLDQHESLKLYSEVAD